MHLDQLGKPHSIQHCNVYSLAHWWEWMSSITDDHDVGSVMVPVATHRFENIAWLGCEEQIKTFFSDHLVGFRAD